MPPPPPPPQLEIHQTYSQNFEVFSNLSVSRFAAKRQPSFFSFHPCALLCCLSSVAFCGGGGGGGGGGGLIVPHVHVLGLIHPEICRMEQEPKAAQNRYMHHNGKWKQKRDCGRWDPVSKNEMQFFSSSSFASSLLSCATSVLLRPECHPVTYMRT